MTTRICCCSLPYDQCCGAKSPPGGVVFTDKDYFPLPGQLTIPAIPPSRRALYRAREHVKQLLDQYEPVPDYTYIYRNSEDPMTKKLTGYRELSELEVELINDIKALGGQMEKICKVVMSHSGQQADGDSYRWVAIGKTHLQQGLMALTRAVARPETF